MSDRREGRRLAAWSRAVRESTLKRLRQVPPGGERFRLSPGAMSIADLARHLVDADRWLFDKLRDPTRPPMVGRAGVTDALDHRGFRALVDELVELGELRAERLEAMDATRLEETIEDGRFGGAVTVWWVVVRGNLDHEAHHRGQLASALRALREQDART